MKRYCVHALFQRYDVLLSTIHVFANIYLHLSLFTLRVGIVFIHVWLGSWLLFFDVCDEKVNVLHKIQIIVLW